MKKMVSAPLRLLGLSDKTLNLKEPPIPTHPALPRTQWHQRLVTVFLGLSKELPRPFDLGLFLFSNASSSCTTVRSERPAEWASDGGDGWCSGTEAGLLEDGEGRTFIGGALSDPLMVLNSLMFSNLVRLRSLVCREHRMSSWKRLWHQPADCCVPLLKVP